MNSVIIVRNTCITVYHRKLDVNFVYGMKANKVSVLNGTALNTKILVTSYNRVSNVSNVIHYKILYIDR